MLQQTRVEAVIPYYERFLAVCPTVQALAALEEDRLMKLWEGLGYYSRARNLHKAARVICEMHGGVFPRDYAALRALPGEDRLMKLWEGLGYYSRARNLHKAARVICEMHGGVFPRDYAALRALPGVGDYTAGAVGSIAFGLPVPAVDGNVLRVIARLTDDHRSIDDIKVRKDITKQVQEILPAGRSGDLNQALMELGATVCVPNGAPKCSVCPLMHLCRSYAEGTALALPVRTPKKKRRVEARTVLVLRCGNLTALRRRPEEGLLAGLWELPAYEGKLTPDEVRTALSARTVLVLRCGNLTALRRRPEEGLLAGLWELPAYEGKLTPDEVRTALSAQGFRVREVLSLRPAKHIFTHIEWHMTGYYVELEAIQDGLTWVTPAQLHGEYALPSAFRTFRAVVEGGEHGV